MYCSEMPEPTIASDNKVFYISVTGVVIQDDKFLIVKRSLKEKAFPGKWTVPGGKVQSSGFPGARAKQRGLVV